MPCQNRLSGASRSAASCLARTMSTCQFRLIGFQPESKPRAAVAMNSYGGVSLYDKRLEYPTCLVEPRGVERTSATTFRSLLRRSRHRAHVDHAFRVNREESVVRSPLRPRAIYYSVCATRLFSPPHLSVRPLSLFSFGGSGRAVSDANVTPRPSTARSIGIVISAIHRLKPAKVEPFPSNDLKVTQ